MRQRELATQAHSTFFVQIGAVSKLADQRCEYTMPLFPLWLILNADGTLASELAPLVQQTQA